MLTRVSVFLTLYTQLEKIVGDVFKKVSSYT